MFSKRLKFIKIISKLDFADWHVLRENWDMTYMLILEYFWDIITAWLLHRLRFLDYDTMVVGFSRGTDGLRHNYCTEFG